MINFISWKFYTISKKQTNLNFFLFVFTHIRFESWTRSVTEWTVSISSKPPAIPTYNEYCRNKYPWVTKECRWHLLVTIPTLHQLCNIKWSTNNLNLCHLSCSNLNNHLHSSSKWVFHISNNQGCMLLHQFPLMGCSTHKVQGQPQQELVSLNNHHTPTLKRLCKNFWKLMLQWLAS